MRDLAPNLGIVLALAPAVQSAAVNGPAIDTLKFGSVAIAVSTGAIAGAGDFGVKLQHSDSDQSGDFTDAPAADVTTNAPATLEASAAYKLGYRGNKRFVRLAVTKAGGTSIAAGAVALKGYANERPVA